MTDIKVIIVEDVPLELKGTIQILKTEVPEAKVIATAQNEEEFWNAIDTELPDLVLLDIGLGGARTAGIDIAQKLHKKYPSVRVLVFTGEVLDEKVWVEALNTGVKGILLKEGELISRNVITGCMDGNRYNFNQPILEKIIDRFKASVTNETTRQESVIEYEIDEFDERILRHLALGYTKDMICSLRGIPFGVKSLEKRQVDLINRIFPEGQRHGVNATRLVVRAIELGIINPNSLSEDEE